MTADALARSYLVKVEVRMLALHTLFNAGGYSDVVREAQEIVELALKGILRFLGIDPPKIHDVGKIVAAHSERLPELTSAEIEMLVVDSAYLRRERELSLYGDIDFIPTEEYKIEEGQRAFNAAMHACAMLAKVLA